MPSIRLILFICIIAHSSISAQVEICDNGIDDDNDSFIDLNDADCICEMAMATSLIPNPSFEELNCCPDGRSQLFCATDWIQASVPTTDFIHLCDWSGINEYPPPQPFPDGDGILGFRDGRFSSSDTLDAYWKEYAGACLLSPLKEDSFYRLQFDIGFVDSEISPPINVSLFGTTNCDNLPFGIGDATFGCPTNSPDWVRLGEVYVSGGSGNNWQQAFIDIIPDSDIQAIALGPDCDPVVGANVIYYYFDNLHLIDLASFDLLITEVLHPCNQNFTLKVPANTDFEFQWYLSGVALVGETSPQLSQNYGEGSYQARIQVGSSCRLSAVYDYMIPSYNYTDSITICRGDTYAFGELVLMDTGYYIDTLLTQDNCDSIINLQLDVIGESSDTVEVSIASGETFKLGTESFSEEGQYLVPLPSSLGCDSLILLILNQFNVYIPNIFSPNNDGLNDVFQPLVVTSEVRSYDMKIYDRWGSIVYQGNEWDGSDLRPNVFVYEIQVEFTNGQSTVYYGTMSLVR